ncbi:MAG TPA: histidine phosphatase family protein [Usitatibacteraceae bacterium]|nr:histidine phosphatase family protein [Usitatibacteraceae bacterium]
MELILWRHAEAEDEAPSDLLRPLSAKGRKQAARMAAWIHQRLGEGIGDWRVLVSPALRTEQTAAALKLPVETRPALAPGAQAQDVLREAGWPRGRRNAIVVGHQPTLGMAAAELLNGVPGHLSVKKGALWWFEMRGEDGEVRLKAVAAPDTVS